MFIFTSMAHISAMTAPPPTQIQALIEKLSAEGRREKQLRKKLKDSIPHLSTYMMQQNQDKGRGYVVLCA